MLPELWSLPPSLNHMQAWFSYGHHHQEHGTGFGDKSTTHHTADGYYDPDAYAGQQLNGITSCGGHPPRKGQDTEAEDSAWQKQRRRRGKQEGDVSESIWLKRRIMAKMSRK